MPIFMSDNSENLLKKAEQLSFRLGHFYVGCEHLFLSILDNEDWLPKEITAEGGDVDDLRRVILEIAGPGDEEPLWNGLITTPRLKRVLKAAEKEAELQKSVRVEPNHLIMAICREEKSVPSRALSEIGVDPSYLRQKLAIMGVPEPASASSKGAGYKYPTPGMPYSAFMEAKKKEKDVYSREKEKEKERKSKTPTLDKLGRDLVEAAREGKMDPIVGRKDEIRRVIQTLTKKMKNNPIIIGEAGVGKTAVVYGLAQRIAEGNVPDAIKHKYKRIIEVGMAGIVAGTKHRGEFEERMQQIIEELLASPDIILFIDEIHTIMGAGDSRSGMDAGNILKPYLARGEITIIGATTTDEYRKYIEKDPALERRFQPIFVDEPSEEETLEILKGLIERYEKHHGVTFSPKALIQAVKMSVRYIPDRNLPDKAIDLLDEAAAKSTMKSISDADDFKNMKNEVTEEDIAEVVALWTGIPAANLTKDESEKLLHMEDALKKVVVGQDEAIKIVSQTIRMVRMGLSSPNRPSGVFLFLGPTGVGKTEMAKALAEFLFGSPKDMVRLDMSEYAEKHAIARMIGSPPGYIGHDEEGQLTKEIRTKPYSVILLDEVEKAHPEVFDLFLQVFDEGRLTDSKGRTVNFTNTIIIMTSNIGTSNVDSDGRIQLLNTSDPRTREKIMQELRQHFRPEFLNRIDEIIIFNPLNEDALREIVKINLNSLIKQLAEQREIRLVVDESAELFLLKVGYDPAYGARPMKRAIQNYLAKPLAEAMLEQGIRQGDEVIVSCDGNRLTFSRGGEIMTVGETIGEPESYSPSMGDEEWEVPPREEQAGTAPLLPSSRNTITGESNFLRMGKPSGMSQQDARTDKIQGGRKSSAPRDQALEIKPRSPEQGTKQIDRAVQTPPSPPQHVLKAQPPKAKQPVKNIPFDTKRKSGELEVPQKMPPTSGKENFDYPLPKKPILKQRDHHQDIKGIMPMKGPITGWTGMPGNLDDEDFEQTRPRFPG